MKKTYMTPDMQVIAINVTSGLMAISGDAPHNEKQDGTDYGRDSDFDWDD